MPWVNPELRFTPGQVAAMRQFGLLRTPEGDDRSHRPTCDWNLYRQQRGIYADLCNLDCLTDPTNTSASWAMLEPDR